MTYRITKDETTMLIRRSLPWLALLGAACLTVMIPGCATKEYDENEWEQINYGTIDCPPNSPSSGCKVDDSLSTVGSGHSGHR